MINCQMTPKLIYTSCWTLFDCAPINNKNNNAGKGNANGGTTSKTNDNNGTTKNNNKTNNKR